MREHSFSRFVLSNLGWMAASIFLALVVWVAASMSNNPVEQRAINNIPIALRLPEGYVIQRQSAQNATAIVRAQKSEWPLLVAGDVMISADLSDVRKPGEYRVELAGELASARHGSVIAVRPSTVTIEVDQEAEKRTGVIVLVRREPPLGYSYPSDLTCDQTEVLVRGSAERVEQVDHVEVRMDLSDQRNPITQSYDLIPVAQNGRTVTTVELVPASVSCFVDIQAREDVIQMRVLPEVINDPPEGYIFEGYDASPESVGVTGDRAAISSLNGLVHTAPIDLTDQTETFTTEIPLALPAGVTLVPENQTVRVTVTISPVRSSRQFQEVPVEITGLDPTQYKATVLPNAVTVLVVGPEALLPNRSDLRVSVNLSGLTPGNHQVTPIGEMMEDTADGEMSVTVRPEQVSVTIEPLVSTPAPSPTAPLVPQGSPTAAATAPGASPTP